MQKRSLIMWIWQVKRALQRCLSQIYTPEAEWVTIDGQHLKREKILLETLEWNITINTLSCVCVYHPLIHLYLPGFKSRLKVFLFFFFFFWFLVSFCLVVVRRGKQNLVSRWVTQQWTLMPTPKWVLFPLKVLFMMNLGLYLFFFFFFLDNHQHSFTVAFVCGNFEYWNWWKSKDNLWELVKNWREIKFEWML